MLSNAPATTASESPDSETGSGPPNVPAESFPYDLIYNAIVPDPSSILSVIIRTAIIAIIFFKVIDYLTLKSRRFRNSLEPKPILLVEYGSIVKEGLKKAKMDIIEFEAEMRLEGIENLSEIKYARLESNGKISFIMKRKMTSDEINGD